MEAIAAAIYSFITGDATAGTPGALTSNRIYFAAAPQNATKPYIVFEFVSSRTTWAFGSGGTPKEFPEPYVQFTIVTGERHNVASAFTLLTSLRAKMNHAALSITGYSCVACVPQSSVGPYLDEDRIVATQDYIVTAQKT